MEILSNQAKFNRRKALGIILFEGKTTNKAVLNIIKKVEQQTFLLVQLENKLLDNSMTFEEIYSFLKEYDKNLIVVAAATIIKNNMDYAVIEKGGEEQAVEAILFEQIELEPEKYILSILKNNRYFLDLKNIFGERNYYGNLFLNISENMHRWLYSLPKYTTVIKKRYVGNGKYESIGKDIINFKNSLCGIVKNPYFYISSTLPGIFEGNTYDQIEKTKFFIDETTDNLKSVLQSDIDSVFPETLYKWYQSLSPSLLERIYKNGEEYFFKFCSDKNFSIDKLCRDLTGLSLENWNEDTPTVFYEKLIRIRKTIETIDGGQINGGFVIQYLDKNRNKNQKTLDVTQIENNETAKLLAADVRAALKDYGTSLDHLSKIGTVLKLLFEEMAK